MCDSIGRLARSSCISGEELGEKDSNLLKWKEREREWRRDQEWNIAGLEESGETEPPRGTSIEKEGEKESDHKHENEHEEEGKRKQANHKCGNERERDREEKEANQEIQ